MDLFSVCFIQDAAGPAEQPGPGPAPDPGPLHRFRRGNGSAASGGPAGLPLHLAAVPLRGLHLHTLSGKDGRETGQNRARFR